jgi:hypothetical protein
MKTFKKLLLVPFESEEKQDTQIDNNLELEIKNNEIKNVLVDKSLSDIAKVIEIDKKQIERNEIVKPEDIKKFNIEALNKRISELFKKKIPKSQKIDLINSEILQYKNIFNQNSTNEKDIITQPQIQSLVSEQQQPAVISTTPLVGLYADVFSSATQHKPKRKIQNQPSEFMTQPVEKKSKKQRNKLTKHLSISNKETTEINPFTPADLTLNNTYDNEDYEDLKGKFTRTAREPINSATKNFTRLQNQLWENFNQK